METLPTDVGFFVAGGTVPPGSPSYVERAADRDLLEALLAGEFCYVLNARQMGKSSLAVRTIDRLSAQSVRTAFVDLTRVGGATVTPEQWYAGLLVEAGRALGLRNQAAAWIKSHRELGPAQRFLSFMHEEALDLVDGPIVLMIDEIDAVRSLPFSTDELFAGLRQLYNGRATDARLGRLTVCLLGAALPSDLIRDPRTTPFNIGRRIELRDFTPEEARPFAAAVGEARLRRILYWTNGHPYLTQVLCADLAGVASKAESVGKTVDALVRERYLDPRARETDTNLSDVGRRLVGEGDPDVGDAERANSLSAYRRVLRERAVLDDEANPAAARIKMSGVARSVRGRLRLRNRIYQRTFDRRWVLDHLPHQELRRQRKAYWKGALRTALVMSTIGGLILLVVYIVDFSERSQEASFSNISLDDDLRALRGLDDRRREHRLGTVSSVTEKLPQGWEMEYWHHTAGPRLNVLRLGSLYEGLAVRGDSRIAVVPSGLELRLIDLKTMKLLATLPNDERQRQARWSRDGRRLLLWNDDGRSVALVDVAAKRTLQRRWFDSRILVGGVSPDDRWALLWTDGGLFRLDLRSFDLATFAPRIETAQRVVLSPDGSRVVAWDRTPNGQRMRAMDLRTGRTLLTNVEAVVGEQDAPCGAAFVAPDRLLAGSLDGQVKLYDLASGRVLGSTRLSSEGAIVKVSADPVHRRALALNDHNQSFLLDLSPGAPTLIRRFDDARFAEMLGDGGRIVTAMGDVRVVTASDPLPPERRLGTFVEGRSFAPDGSATLLLDGRLRSVDLRHLERAPTLLRGSASGLPDETGRFRATWTPQGAEIADRRGTTVGRIGFGLGKPTDFAFDPKGKRVYWGLRRSIVVFNLATARIERRLVVPEELADLHLSPDGRLLVARSVRGGLQTFDAGSGKIRWAREAEYARAAVVRFSPDGGRLGLGMYGRNAKVLDSESGVEMSGTAILRWAPTCLAWTSRGDRLFVGLADGTVHSVGQVSYPNSYHVSEPDVKWTDFGAVARQERPIADVVLLPGDRTLASIDRGGTIRLWMTSDEL